MEEFTRDCSLLVTNFKWLIQVKWFSRTFGLKESTLFPVSLARAITLVSLVEQDGAGVSNNQTSLMVRSD